MSTNRKVTTTDILFSSGGGATAKRHDGSVIAIVDPNNSSYNKITALHEFFGHGRPLSIESPNNIHNADDAILFENLVWRLLGEPHNQRNGSNHGNRVRTASKIPNYNTALPSFR